MEPRIITREALIIIGNVSYGGDIGELWNVFEKNEGEVAALNLGAVSFVPLTGEH